jgi:hypothetical protein
MATSYLKDRLIFRPNFPKSIETLQGKQESQSRSICRLDPMFSGWGKDSAWYKDVTARSNPLWIQVDLRKSPVFIQVLENPIEIQPTLEEFVSESP